MSIEREILRRLNESVHRIDESWPPVLNSLTSAGRQVVRNALTKKGIDIENTPYKEVNITSGRDPRLKGLNVVIFKVRGNGTGTVAVWFDGKFIVNAYSMDDSEYLSKLSWAKILNASVSITSLEFDEGLQQAMRNKQAARGEAQQGMVQRHKPGEVKNTWNGRKITWKASELDKSGYETNPNKYKDMFAKLNIQNGSKILVDAKTVYVTLANNIDNIDFPNDREFHNYEFLMRELLRGFKDLKGYLQDYEKAKAKYTEDDDEWSPVGYRKQQVSDAIADLKDTMQKAKKYL